MSSSTQNLDHLKIPLEDILEATNNFSNENFIRQGGFGKIYKGKLERSGELIDIVARRLDGKFGQGSKEFWTEISMLSSLKHDNLVSIVGFCDEKNEKIVINKYEAKGSLDNYLSDPTLTWLQRLQICVGVARSLNYIHYDEKRDFSVIHRNIKSSKILLDDNYKPKLAGFELSMTNIVSRRHRLCSTDTCGTIGYVDPTYVKTSGVTHKSDIYSFGVVLFEVLLSRKAIINKRDIKLAQLAKSHYEEKQLDDLIDPHLQKQMDQESFNIFAETAYYCLKEQRAERPSIDKIIVRLERALILQQEHENPILKKHQVVADALENTANSYFQWEGLEHLKISFSNIESATDKFSKKYRIRSVCSIRTQPGEYMGLEIIAFVVYKAQLEIFDSKNCLEVEGKCKSELPKKISTVVIKRYYDFNMFYEEMLALSTYKHPNIVSVLGICDDDQGKIIIYDDNTNGCLADHLGNTRNIDTFSWVRRIRICIDVAHGLNYIHGRRKNDETKSQYIISSSNILLKENWEAMIGAFSEDDQTGPSRSEDWKYYSHLKYRAGSYEPIERYGGDRKEQDIYCLGIVLFEILCWRFSHDPIYQRKNDNGLASFVRRCFKNGTRNEILGLKLREEAEETIFSKGIDKKSLDTFLDIAYRCLGNSHFQRPSLDQVIKELKKALYFQENTGKDILKISLDEIMLATENFSPNKRIGKGGFGQVYKGFLTLANGYEHIAAKRLDKKSDQGMTELMTEFEILSEYKHENIVDLVGYCEEKEEKIIVYEYACRGSLDSWLKSDTLTWRKRLMICIDIANGLAFLHGTSETKQEVVIHRDIKSANVLLHGNWQAKIADFGLSLITPINQEMNYVIDNAKGTPGYCDPLYISTRFFTKESDIYSFGVLLFEMLCGRFVMEDNNSKAQNLVELVRHHYKEGSLHEMVFEATKKQIVAESLTTFQNVAYKCILEERAKRPTATDVLIQLKKALEFQEEVEIWEPKLPRDLGKIIQMTYSPKSYYGMSNKDICKDLARGIMLRDFTVCFSLGTDGRRLEVISATEFHLSARDKYTEELLWQSRFPRAAWISDSSKMNIRIKITAHLLLSGVNYGVNLLFKFCDPIENSDTCIDLKYRIGNKSFLSHCTRERYGGWLVKELFQFSSLAEEADIDLFLLGFSESHFKNQAIYVEGIEFRAINNMTQEEMDQLKRSSMANVQQSPTDEGHWKVNKDEVQVLPDDEGGHVGLGADEGGHELPADEGGHELPILLWLLVKCCCLSSHMDS